MTASVKKNGTETINALTGTASEPRWPAVAAFVTAWLCPVTSARRTLHVSLWAAYAVHLAAALLTFLLITVLASAGEGKHLLHYFGEICEEFTSSRWQQALGVLGVSVLSIEIAFLILALVLTPWGASNERLRSSFSHALRITWLHTTHALPTVLLIGILTVAHDRVWRDHERTSPQPDYPPPLPAAPAPPLHDSNNPQAWRDFQRASQEYDHQVNEIRGQSEKAWQEWRQHRPFFLKYGPGAITWLGVACIVWVLRALSQAARIRLPAPPIVHPPICEFCGYNLTAAPIDSRCPECGQLAIDSLGPEVRPGTPWDRPECVGRLLAWWRCGADAVFKPVQFGRQIRTHDQASRHRAFLVTHLPLVFLFGALAVAGCILFNWYRRPNSLHDLASLGIVPPFVGVMTMLVPLAIAGLAAALVGLLYSLRNERNLLPASMQMACYLGLYMTVWAAFGSFLSLVLYALVQEQMLLPLARQLNMDYDLLKICFWFLPNLAFLAGYVALVWRGTSAAQYANR